MKNKEWLQSMEPGELSAWFDAERVDELHDVTHEPESVTKTDEMLFDRVMRENIALAHDLNECMAERDELREKLSQAIDHAYAAVSLLDLNGYRKDEGLA